MKVLLLLLLVGLVAAEPQGTVCDVCKKGVSELQSVIDAVIGKLKKGVSMVCSFLPFDQCEEKVNPVLDFVLNYIKSLDATHLCSMIGNCDEEEVPVAEMSPVGDEATCNECLAQYDNIVAILDKYPQIKTTVQTVLKAVCYLPIENCYQLIEDIVDEAFDELKKGGQELCTQIGQC